MSESSTKSDKPDWRGLMLDLDFPVDRNFLPVPPALSVADAMRASEEILAWFPHVGESQEDRLARKISVEFVL